MLKNTVLALILTSLLASCSNLKPVRTADSFPVTAAKAKAKGASDEGWTEPAIVKEGKPMVVLYTPFSIPDRVAKKQIQAQLEPGATIRDLAAVLGNLGVSIIISDKETSEITFFMPKYTGSLGHMLSAISRAADVWFTYQDGVIVVSSKERIALSIPQDEALAKKVSEGLTAIGLTVNGHSSDAAMVSVELKYSQLSRTKAFLERICQNAALVSLQVAIVTVDITQQDSSGLDWSKMQFALGQNGKSIFDPTGGAAVAGGGTATTAGTTATTTATTSTTGTATGLLANGQPASGSVSIAPLNLPGFIQTAMISGTGARLAFSNSAFSLAGFVNFMGSYGSTETMENLMLKTTTGNKVELKSVTQIPYVSSVGVATTGTANTTNGQPGLLASAKTATADDGVDLKLTPSYDASANTLSLDLDLSLKTVLAMTQLSAGSQIGSLSQPTTATRSFNDILRMRPGETVVVGGITYESTTKSNSGPLETRGTDMDSKQLQITKTTMFIIIRPTVRTFGSLDEKAGDSLFTQGVAPIEEMPAVPVPQEIPSNLPAKSN